jgi:hypothetical protein
MARKRIFAERLTDAEKQRRYRDKKRAERIVIEEADLIVKAEKDRQELNKIISKLTDREVKKILPQVKEMLKSERELEKMVSYISDINLDDFIIT